MEYYEKHIVWEPYISEDFRLILCDAQTSGGLLFSVPEKYSKALLDDLKKHNHNYAGIIGNIIQGIPSRILFH